MKLYHAQRVRFVGKSLLWSLGLYVLCMVFINWDEVNKANKTVIPFSQIATQPINSPVPDNKPNDPQSDVSGFAHAIHTVGTFCTQVVKVISVFKK